MKKSVNRGFTAVIVLMLSIFSAIIFLSLHQTTEAKVTAAMVAHTHEVMFQTSDILSTIKDNETGSRGFLLTGNPAFLVPVEKSKKTIYQAIDTLRLLTRDNPVQHLRIDSFIVNINKKISFSDSCIDIRNKKGLEASVAFVSFGMGKVYMDNIREMAENMQQDENSLLKARELANEKANTILDRTIISIIVVIIILVSILATKDYLVMTERKNVERALRKNEIYLDLMANNIKDYAIFMLDINGLVVSWNRGAETVLGYEKRETTGKSFAFIFTQKDIQYDEPNRNLGLAKKYGQYEKESTLLKNNGQSFLANLVLTALVNDAGKFYGYSVIIRDITERKKAQEQLEFLSHQINHSNDAIFVVDASRKIKSWNRGAENLYGYTTWEVLDQDSNEVLRTSLTKEEINSALKIIDKENHWTGELKRQTKDGRDIFVHSSTSTIQDNRGNITGYVAVSFDITAQKELREEVNHLASLVEQSTEAIVSTDLDEHIISWNTGAEKLYGYSKKEAIGKTPAALGLTKLASIEQSLVLKQIAEKGMWKSEMDLMHKNGSLFFCSVTANIVKNEQGEIKSVVYIINDISLRRQLEERLRKSNEELEQRVKERTLDIYKNEQRFRALIENSAEGIALMDATGSIFYRSPAAYKITGNLPLGNTMGLIHPDDLEIIKGRGMESLEKPEAVIDWQGRFKHASGEYAWMEGTFTNLLHVDGVNAVVANYHNITTRKQAEEKLIASEKQFRQTLDNMLEGVQIIGFDWRYLYVNDSVTVHGKYSKEELVGYTMMEKYPGIEQTEIYRICQRCFTERISFQLENKFVYTDNTFAWFELSCQPVPEGVFILSVDITDRKKTEEELVKSEHLYRNLFENMLHGFCYCKADIENGRLKDFTYLGVNREYELLTGVSDVTGKKMSEINPALLESDNEYINILTKVAQGGDPEKFEGYFKPLDTWFSISIYSPENGYFVNLVDNITESKKHEHKIKKLNKELEARVIKRTLQLKKTNEELEAFSYSVSHDLRAPLRAIIGFTNILEEDYVNQLDHEAKRITSIIKDNTLKMGHLIDDLLTFSRMGRQDIVKTHIDTDMMIREIIDQPEIKQYNHHNPIKWVVHDLPNINGDANTLRQAWINLISNAVKYSNKSVKPEIEIDFYQENDKIIFFVKDNGVGFDEKYKNKLFRVFQRLHSADEFEGTGIGLAIVEKIISKHDGNVWAEAEPGKGATFFFSLPEKV